MRISEVDNMIEEIRNRKYPYTVNCMSLELRVDECVYPPGEESLLLAKNIFEGEHSINPGDQVLDYGTGTGFLALVAAQKGAAVTLTDINPHAVACAEYNINYYKKTKGAKGLFHKPLCGEGFSVLNPSWQAFDLILASLPYDDAEPNNWIEHSFYDKDFKMRKELFANAKNYLFKSTGKILFTYSQKAQEKNPIENFCKGYSVRKVDEAVASNDVYYLLLIKPENV